MQTEAIFENIADRIHREIRQAQHSIYIAVAWFTNKSLFDELLERAKEGCVVSLIVSNDSINLSSRINYEQLREYGSYIYKVGDGDSELMHNKFCIIDHSTVITGSYNWSYKAESNFENIIINYNDTALAESFFSEFIQIRKRYFPEEPKAKMDFPIEKIIKRLEILRNCILLEEIDELKQAASKLEEYSFNSDIDDILVEIKQNELAKAILKIQSFVSSNKQVTSYVDPEIIGLKFELKLLENQLSAFENEKLELEKLLSDFQFRHTKELGDTILEILKLRKIKYKSDNQKFREAETDEQHYREQVEYDKKQQKFNLSDNEKKELKKKFRMATVLCHPDKVNEKLKKAANEIFIDLKEAYDANDLRRVAELLYDLEKGNYFISQSDALSELQLLKAEIARLRKCIKSLEDGIISIKENDTYKTIIAIDDWDDYFIEMKIKLKMELQEMEKEIYIQNNANS